MGDFDFNQRSACRFRQVNRDPLAEFGHGVMRAAVGAFVGCLLALFAWEKITAARLQMVADQIQKDMMKAIKGLHD